MEQTDAEAERHVFGFFFGLFFSRTFWKPLQTSSRHLYIIRMCTLSLNIELLYGTPPLLLWKTVTARVAPSLGVGQPNSRYSSPPGGSAHLARTKVVNKAHSFRHLCHLYTRHSCIPFYVWTAFHATNSRLFATVFSIELRQSVSSTKVSILVMGVVKGITVQD